MRTPFRLRKIACLFLFGALATAAEAASRPAHASAGRRKAPPRKAAAARIPMDPATVNDPALAPRVGPGSAGGGVLRAQVLLSRAHFSCGEIDGRYGTSLKKAIEAFQRSRGLPVTGVVDPPSWKALSADTLPILVSAPVAPEDVAGPFVPIPADTMEKAELPALGFTSALEGLAEKYHASPDLLRRLNPDVSFESTQMSTILAPNVLAPPPAPAVAQIVVSKSGRSVSAVDADGRIVAFYPATIGSVHDPLPLGRWKVLGVSRNPVFHYNPELFWDAKSNDRKTRLAPGPNNPVGVAWIDLTKPHYGIHGTPEPSRVGKTESHGCIRLTNWDVWELQQIVTPGTPALLEK